MRRDDAFMENYFSTRTGRALYIKKTDRKPNKLFEARHRFRPELY